MESNSHLFNAAICPSGVRQAAIGDCYFVSALASQANTAEGCRTIRNSIRQDSACNYTVTFAGDRTHPVYVSQSDIAHAKVNDVSKWANISETAYLKYSHLRERGVFLAKASSTGEAIHLLTGKKAHNYHMGFIDCDNKVVTFGKTPTETIRRDLSLAMAHGEVVTARTNAYFPGFTHDHDSLPREHVYSVLGYDTKCDTVTIRNPWTKSGDGKLSSRGDKHNGITYLGDGVMTMSFDTFNKRFNGLSIAGAK